MTPELLRGLDTTFKMNMEYYKKTQENINMVTCRVNNTLERLHEYKMYTKELQEKTNSFIIECKNGIKIAEEKINQKNIFLELLEKVFATQKTEKLEEYKEETPITSPEKIKTKGIADPKYHSDDRTTDTVKQEKIYQYTVDDKIYQSDTSAEHRLYPIYLSHGRKVFGAIDSKYDTQEFEDVLSGLNSRSSDDKGSIYSQFKLIGNNILKISPGSTSDRMYAFKKCQSKNGDYPDLLIFNKLLKHDDADKMDKIIKNSSHKNTTKLIAHECEIFDQHNDPLGHYSVQYEDNLE